MLQNVLPKQIEKVCCPSHSYIVIDTTDHLA